MYYSALARVALCCVVTLCDQGTSLDSSEWAHCVGCPCSWLLILQRLIILPDCLPFEGWQRSQPKLTVCTQFAHRHTHNARRTGPLMSSVCTCSPADCSNWIRLRTGPLGCQVLLMFVVNEGNLSAAGTENTHTHTHTTAAYQMLPILDANFSSSACAYPAI